MPRVSGLVTEIAALSDSYYASDFFPNVSKPKHTSHGRSREAECNPISLSQHELNVEEAAGRPAPGSVRAPR